MMTQEYQNKFVAFQRGEITREEWCAFCFKVLCILLAENKEIFVRLKNA